MSPRPGGGRGACAAPLTLRAALAGTAKDLAATSPTPRLDAEALVSHVSAASRAAMAAHPERPLAAAARRSLARLVERRRQGEPVAYLVGRREFWSLDLMVTPATLIPRPDTELLVERALVRIPETARWTAVDLGTGSGAVALALARERPRLEVIATDASHAALGVARSNAERLGIRNVAFRAGDWFAPLGDKRHRIVVSNPPYVCTDDPRLSQSELRFEPRAALDGGRHGLAAIQSLVAQARAHLAPGGWLLLEHGFDQGEPVRALLGARGYAQVQTYRDLAANERVTEARAA